MNCRRTLWIIVDYFRKDVRSGHSKDFERLVHITLTDGKEEQFLDWIDKFIREAFKPVEVGTLEGLRDQEDNHGQ